MTSRTHIAVGIAASIPIINTSNLFFTPLILIGALMPDIDVKLKWKHRSFSHSILALAITTHYIYTFTKVGAIFFFLGYFSHIVLDMITKKGVRLLYPFKSYYGFKFSKTGGILDDIIFVLAVFIIVFRVTHYF